MRSLTLLQIIGAILLPFLTLAQEADLEGGRRILTNNEGRKISVSLLAADQTKVRVKTSSGSEFVIPLANLVQADQEFIAKWLSSDFSLITKEGILMREVDKRLSSEVNGLLKDEGVTATMYMYTLRTSKGKIILDPGRVRLDPLKIEDKLKSLSEKKVAVTGKLEVSGASLRGITDVKAVR
ncbi:MAG: hypothetical protein P1V20_08840 [Verrucomicrobiales bacterium]|nr:hypothetical protein [Verrucomicrobiales bacterium]